MKAAPGNLTREARLDLRQHLRRSRDVFGPEAARKLSARFLDGLCRIEMGQAIGHVRDDLPFAEPTRCLTVRPFLVIYNPESRIVLRIVDGRRDLTALSSG